MTDANRARRPSKRVPGGGNAAAPAPDEARRRSRRLAERRGHWAETLAALWLTFRGYRVLARRVKSPAGEVDLVVRRGTSIVAVEVKARPSLEAAVAGVSPRQRRRVAQGLEGFVARHPELAGLDRRFDLVAVRPWRLPVHLVDVWRPDR